jgi:hypothetical protein
VMENIFDDLREAGSITQRLIMLESALQQHSNNAPRVGNSRAMHDSRVLLSNPTALHAISRAR